MVAEIPLLHLSRAAWKNSCMAGVCKRTRDYVMYILQLVWSSCSITIPCTNRLEQKLSLNQEWVLDRSGFLCKVLKKSIQSIAQTKRSYGACIYKMSNRNMCFHSWALIYLRYKQRSVQNKVNTVSLLYANHMGKPADWTTGYLASWHKFVSINSTNTEKTDLCFTRVNPYGVALRLKWSLFSRFWPIHQSTIFVGC